MRGIKQLITTFLFVLFCSSGFSQSFYELKFTVADGGVYTAFWVYGSESENYIRMAYYNENGEYRVVNIDYYAETGTTEDGVYYFALMGDNATWISDYTEDDFYNPDHYVWVRYENEEYGLPLVTDDPEFAAENFFEVTSYIELDPLQFTKEYLNQFYGTNEPDYIALMNLVNQHNDYLVSDHDSNTDQFQYNSDDTNTDTEIDDTPITMHLIVAANTAIGDIGASCEVDKRNLVNEFEGICEVMDINLKQYIVDAKNFTKAQLIKTLGEVQPGTNDIVFFTYTGHGFRWSDQTGNYPQLDMRYNPYTQITAETSINLEEVYNIIIAKGARLNLVLGDCCNSDVGVNQRTNNTFLASRNEANFNHNNLRKLFVKSQGNIIATAASPGQVSWSNSVNGGFFLSSFFQAFREEIGYLDTDPQWEDMLESTIKYAAYKSSKSACNNCTIQNGQKAISVSY
ncbi:MAG: hypothetical protein GQ574_24000 [Crocinitomix sp.]|nr:hypothetical protein [Crocinitomix sp.]